MISRMISYFLSNPEYLKSYFIPGAIFCLDFILRLILDIDLIDAGADMALIGVATFLSIVIEDADNRQRFVPIGLLCMLVFLIFWMLCLSVIAIEPITFSWSGMFDFRLFFSWFLGLITFIFAGILSNQILVYANTQP